ISDPTAWAALPASRMPRNVSCFGSSGVAGVAPRAARRLKRNAMRVALPFALGLLAAGGIVARVSARPDLRPIVLRAVTGHVAQGEEKQQCFPVEFPRGRETEVGHVQIRVHGGSHHVHLY